MISKKLLRLSVCIGLVCLLASCQADDRIVQSLFDLSGAPVQYGGISIIN